MNGRREVGASVVPSVERDRELETYRASWLTMAQWWTQGIVRQTRLQKLFLLVEMNVVTSGEWDSGGNVLESVEREKENEELNASSQIIIL